MHGPKKPQERTVVVLGASPKPVRYSYQAVKLLKDKGYRVIPVHPKAQRIEDPAEWTQEKIVEKGRTLSGKKGPEGDFED